MQCKTSAFAEAALVKFGTKLRTDEDFRISSSPTLETWRLTQLEKKLWKKIQRTRKGFSN